MNQLADSLATKQSHEKSIYVNSVDFAALSSEVAMLEKNEIALLKHDMAKLRGENERLTLRISEDLRRIQSGVRIELSNDKSVIRDSQATQKVHCILPSTQPFLINLKIIYCFNNCQ